MEMDFEKQLSDLQKKVNKMEKGTKDQLSMVVFSGDLDKILAAMIIATGATAMDMKVIIETKTCFLRARRYLKLMNSS